MNITMIAGYYPPEQCADTRLNKDFATSLSNMGHKVTVVVPFPTRNVPAEVQVKYREKKCEILSDNLKIIRVGNPDIYKEGLIQRGWNLFWKSFTLYSEAKKIKTDVYFVVSTPPFLGYVAALLSKKAFVIYKLEDIFPDSLMYVKNYGEQNLLIKGLRKLEKWVYRNVSLIVTESRDMQYTLINRGVSQSRIVVIPDWIDEDSCYPVIREDNVFFDKFNLNREDFYVCYAGNIGLLQNVTTIVRAAKIIARKYPKIKFVIIGNGSCKTEVEKEITDAGIENVFLFPMQPEKELAYIYSLGDVGIVSIKTGVTKIALPSKTWAIMSAGRPVICEVDKSSALSELMDKENCGYTVSSGDVLELVKRIIELYRDRNLVAEMGKNGRKYILENMTRHLIMKKYEELFQASWRINGGNSNA